MLQIRAHAYSILLWVLIKININPYNHLLQSFSLTSSDWYYCCSQYCIAELTVCKELWKSSYQTVSQPTLFPSGYGKGKNHHLKPNTCASEFLKAESQWCFQHLLCLSQGHKVTVYCYLLLTCYMSSDSFF